MDLKKLLQHGSAHSAVRRVSARASNLQSGPRVSTVGSLLALVIIGTLASAITLAVFLSNVTGRLQVQANEVIERFEKLVNGATAELSITAPLLEWGCSAKGLEVLTQQSLKSRILDQIHLRQGASGEICSAIKTSQPAVHAWSESVLDQLNAMSPAVLLAANEYGLLIARHSDTGQTLIGEIRTGDLQLHLGDAQSQGYRAIIRRLDNSILFDSAGLFRPGSFEMLGAMPVGPSAQSILESVKAEATGISYPIRVEVTPTQLILIKTGSRYLLTAVSLAVVLTLLLIMGFNQYLIKRISVERQLKIALNRRNFVPVIQPIVDAQTGSCKGGEVLMRWDHPARGLVSPVEFLPVAERLGLMGAMTMIIMERASQVLAGLAREFPQLYFSFNVDASQLRDPLFPEQLRSIFHSGALPANQVLLEIVEREAVDEQARVGLDRLRDAGYRIAIDDFGTGQSSLSMLLSIGFDVLKIDRSFVSAVDGSQVNRPVLDAIIDIAQKLDVTAVAEGVETVEQHAFLVSKGVDAIQGYLVSKPMPVAQFPDWLRQSKNRPAAYCDSTGSSEPKKTTPDIADLDSSDTAQEDDVVHQETAANLRQFREKEQHSARQIFRLHRPSELLPKKPRLALSDASNHYHEPRFMPV